MTIDPEPPVVLNCPACGTQLAPALLTCPQCHRLVHSDELNRLAKQADRATRDSDLVGAQENWRHALELLPPNSRQYQIISGKVADLSQRVDSGSAIPSGAAPTDANQRTSSKFGWTKGPAGLGAFGLLFWKFKFILAFIATKGKLLLLGVTKGGTFLSMFASLGVYWTAWGWMFALGLVVSIYVHEMGHVAALRGYGMKASAPMFIPGLGALIRLKQMPVNAREDARIGLAGPIWGLTAAFVAYVVGWCAGWPSWIAIASVAAWINLFNLLPVWQLDGARGLRALCKHERWWLFGAVAMMWLLTKEGLLLLILIVASVRMFLDRPPEKPDRIALVQFLVLIVALSFLAGLGVLPDTKEVAGPV